MLDAELEMAAAWNSLSIDQKREHLRKHPFSRFKKGGMHEHLTNLGWTKTGRGTYTHANGRTLRIHPSKTHKYNFSVTHPNGDVSHHKINNELNAAWALTKHSNLSKKQKGKKDPNIVRKPRTVKPAPAPAPVAVAPKKEPWYKHLLPSFHKKPAAAPAPAPVSSAPVAKRGRGRPRKVAAAPVQTKPAAPARKPITFKPKEEYEAASKKKKLNRADDWD